MDLNKPIFIIGAGRSGTTVLYNHLAIHPEVGWFSNYSNKYPSKSSIALSHRLLNIPFVGNYFKNKLINNKKLFLRPSEGGNIYHKYTGFRHDSRTTEQHAHEIDSLNLYDTIESHLRFSGKTRFLSKQTANTQRIRLINHLFKKAVFIHVVRDGRSVANSLSKVQFWNDIDLWWADEEQKEIHNFNKIEYCAAHWKYNINEILNNKYLFEDRYLEVRYENLCKDFKGEIIKILKFSNLVLDQNFLEFIPITLPNRDYKWKKDLSQEEQSILLNLLEKDLQKLGYI